MSSNNPLTEAEFLTVEGEFEEAIKLFRPVFGNESHISLAQKLSRLGMDTALYLKHKGKKGESVYKRKVYDARKNVTSTLNYYFKVKDTNKIV